MKGHVQSSAKQEEVAGRIISCPLFCLLRMSLARTARLIVCQKQDTIIVLACHFGRGIILASGNHAGTRENGKI